MSNLQAIICLLCFILQTCTQRIQHPQIISAPGKLLCSFLLQSRLVFLWKCSTNQNLRSVTAMFLCPNKFWIMRGNRQLLFQTSHPFLQSYFLETWTCGKSCPTGLRNQSIAKCQWARQGQMIYMSFTRNKLFGLKAFLNQYIFFYVI